jgi:hypothetical protein
MRSRPDAMMIAMPSPFDQIGEVAEKNESEDGGRDDLEIAEGGEQSGRR